MSTTLLGPAFIAVGDGTSTFGRLAVENGRIASVLAADGPSDFPLPAGSSIAPGLIDLHTNGADEYLFNRDQGNALGIAGRSYAANGATGFRRQRDDGAVGIDAPRSLRSWSKRPISSKRGRRVGRVAWAFISKGLFSIRSFRRIHHDTSGCCRHSASHAQEMVDACKGACLLVTMAPEIEGAADALRVFLENGVACSAGHTGARYREGMLAIGLGFRSLTHAFNGMPPLDHRDPSILAAFIQDRRTLVQVLCDGFHVSPVMIDILHRTLGDRVVLVTDNMPAADPGYHIEGGVMRAEDGTIAGSALRIDEALRNYMSYARFQPQRKRNRRHDTLSNASHPLHDGADRADRTLAAPDRSLLWIRVPRRRRCDGRRPFRLQPNRSRGLGR